MSDLLDKLIEEVETKESLCLAYLQHKYIPPHDEKDDYYMYFDLDDAEANVKIKRIVLAGFTQDTVQAFQELYKRYGFIVLTVEEALNPEVDAKMYYSKGAMVFVVSKKHGVPGHLKVIVLNPLKFAQLKYEMCLGCEYKSQCSIGCDIKSNLPAW